MTRNQKRSESPTAVLDDPVGEHDSPQVDGSCFVKPDVTAQKYSPLIPDMPLFLQLSEVGK
jgi:hypothetical protein